MVLLETPEHERLVYLEVQRASFLVEDPEDISEYHLQMELNCGHRPSLPTRARIS
ncbi:hypothetical protein SFUMM280S_02480 [Streptomyces fumanus]